MAKGRGDSAFLRWHRSLHDPVAAHSLVLPRVVFGGLMTLLVIRFFVTGQIERLYLAQTLHFKYPFLGWVPDPTPAMLNTAFVLVGIAGIAVAAGFYYRVAIAALFLCWSYIFFCDQTAYQNHDYLIVILSGLMCFMPLNRMASIDLRLDRVKSSDTVPGWCLFVMRFQIAIVYFWGGIRKINPDWLRGEPIRSMLHTEAFEHPVIGECLFSEPLAMLFAYGGLVLDLAIVPALLWKRTRIAAYAVVVGFHLTNAWLWDIDIFPWFMIAATLLFFRPDFPKMAMVRAGLIGDDGSNGEPSVSPVRDWRRILTTTTLGIFCLVQMLIPCRPFLHSGHPLEQQDLLVFSWNMMLRLKATRLQFRVVDNATGEQRFVQPEEFLSPFQAEGRLGSPDMMHQAALYLARQYSEGGKKDVSVYLLGESRVHARDWQVAYDPRVDLAATPRSLGPKSWVVPFVEKYPPDPAMRTAFERAKWRFCKEQGFLPFTRKPLNPEAADEVRKWEEAYRRALQSQAVR